MIFVFCVVLFCFFARQLRGHSCTLMMTRPHYVNFATTFFFPGWKKMCRSQPPPPPPCLCEFFRTRGAPFLAWRRSRATKYFATPNKTPWRRPCKRIRLTNDTVDGRALTNLFFIFFLCRYLYFCC